MNCITMVVTHKKADIPKKEGYLPIIVGKDNVEIDGAVRDNTGENIANKNSNFCELTAQYWFWKNYKEDYDAVGLAHYRRYLTSDFWSCDSKSYLDSKKVKEILEQYDIILPQKFIFPCSTATYYDWGSGRKKDLERTREIIEKKYPEYLATFDQYLKGNNGSYCNMFYMKKKLFEEYNEWLFDILFSLEREIDLSDYTPAEARVFGYISELLLNVWVEYKQLNISYAYMAKCEFVSKNYRWNQFKSLCDEFINNFIFRLKYKKFTK